MFDEEFDGFCVAMPGSPMEGGGVVLAAGVDWQSGFEEEAEGGKIAFTSGVGQRARLIFCDLRDDVRMAGEKTFDGGFVVKPAVVDELDVGRAAIEEEFQDVFMAKLFRDLVRRDGAAKCPDVDRPAGVGIGHRKRFVIYALKDGFGICIEVLLDEFEVAESGGEEYVCFGASLDEETRDFRMFADEVLSGSGFVIDVFGVDFGAVIEQ